jgi:2-polyprenyl-3-methyl-5-hydroxy-6-metoxy-1,4-benzoquinol methylase
MKTILDIGAYDGCASKGFVEEGDRWIWVDNQQHLKYDGAEGTRWGKVRPPPNAELHIMDGMDWKEPADIVVCSNVIYHVPDPIAFIKHLRELTLGKLYIRIKGLKKPFISIRQPKHSEKP